jgi:hypothetical protein
MLSTRFSEQHLAFVINRVAMRFMDEIWKSFRTCVGPPQKPKARRGDAKRVVDVLA